MSERKEVETEKVREQATRKKKEREREKEEERKRERDSPNGCCVLLHFVLTRCMRLLGNSPYAPFIYNSATNAGHAGPHPRSVIRLRATPKRQLKTVARCLECAHARTYARIELSVSRARIFRGGGGGHPLLFPLFLPRPTLATPLSTLRILLAFGIACLVIRSDHTTKRNICIIFWQDITPFLRPP